MDRTTLMQQLHAEHAAALWGYCLRLTGNDRARAEDVVQETLLRAWRQPSVLAGTDRSARAWLYVVARHIVVDEWRARQAHGEVPVAEVPDVLEVAEGDDRLLLAWVVADALRALSREHQDVLRECYYRGRSVPEAARVLGIPEGTVKSRTHYALRALRLALEEMGVTA